MARQTLNADLGKRMRADRSQRLSASVKRLLAAGCMVALAVVAWRLAG